MSTDYYVRLEQGREKNPSPQVLEALATALLLDDEAATYLRGLTTPVSSRSPSRNVKELACRGLVKLMEAWPATPALVQGRDMDVLATNALGRSLFSWLGDEGNLLRAIFQRPEARSFYRDWATIAEEYVAALRAANTNSDDPHVHELIAELSISSPEFAALWGRHEVVTQKSDISRLHHPVVGDVSLLTKFLSSTSSPGQQLVVYYAEPGSPAESALALLGSGTAEV